MTRKLIIHDGHSQRELLLIGTIVVGRDPSCHITDLDPLLSRRHAEFVTTDDRVTVRDLGSRNGMLVNGEKVDEQVLAEGDLVQLGHLQVRYVERLSVYTPEAKIRSHATTAMSMEAANRAAGLAPDADLPDITPQPSPVQAAPNPDDEVTRAPRPRDPGGAAPLSDADPTVAPARTPAPAAPVADVDATFVSGAALEATFVRATTAAADPDATFAVPARPGADLDATFAPGIDIDRTFVPGRQLPSSAAEVSAGAHAQLVAGYDLRVTSASAGCRAVFGAAPETLVGQTLGDLVARSLRTVTGSGGPSSLSFVVERSSSDRTLTVAIKAGPLAETRLMTVPKTLEKIGRYQVLERVGKGGMGVLYRGFDPVLDREVAIKLMHADFSEDTEQMRPRFYREARAAAKLNHRNIVTIFEFAEESNIPYIVMEFLRGNSLGARMNGVPPLTLDDKLNVVAQLCDGLSYAHEQGVVHRDVKPDNVFILEDGSVKLLDFGIAKLTSSTLTRQGDVLGSASYMSPEQVGGSESVDGRADVFSTGVVLYELLCGRKPFEGDSPTSVIIKILKEEPTPIETHAPALPPELVAAVMKALQKDPDRRFPTAEALGRELQSIRKSIHPSMSNARMDETRFASTQVMKALHEDFKKGGGAIRTPTAVKADAEDLELTRAAAPAAARSGWVIPAGVAAVLVLAVGGFLFSRGSTPAAPSANASSTSPSAVDAGRPPSVATLTTSAGAPASGAGPTSAAATSASNAGSGSASATSGNSTAAAPAGAPTTRPAAGSARSSVPAATGPVVSVSLTGGYPFEVYDGSRSISGAATSHDLKQPAGKTLRVQAPQYFLNQTVRVEGSPSQPFEYAAPGLGGLDVRSAEETCDVAIGSRKLGNPPLVIKDIAAGSYKVDIVCGGDVVKSHYATVRAGQTYVAAIR